MDEVMASVGASGADRFFNARRRGVERMRAPLPELLKVVTENAVRLLSFLLAKNAAMHRVFESEPSKKFRLQAFRVLPCLPPL
ncbi:hypothetical protein K4L06_14980 [Lysobacter sp. BMK333-48F3]|uniref:hypothetical protein n=1 Tax=Lysobacter sp. BMK333-48F3 TaxID=2867962 RepID=UPI001C8BDDDB|nr:hypothetical protein [Lysobacter sp. BMK333-48F3]MBX9402612.1 hypothetical protein [Lysobacter sp. BMK333-48F3]